MPRFALRNQKKISEALGEKTLIRILSSLKSYFENGINPDDIKEVPGSKYSVISVNDTGHSCGLILLYIVGTKYDVYRLAFWKFLN